MKTLFKFFLVFFLSFYSLGIGAFSVSWDSTPGIILDEIKDDEVQNTALDDAGSTSGLTMSSIALEQAVPPYIQWIAYIGLSIALLAIIYNGMILILNMGDQSKIGVVKKRLISITVGVVLVVGAYLLLEIVLSLIGNLTP